MCSVASQLQSLRTVYAYIKTSPARKPTFFLSNAQNRLLLRTGHAESTSHTAFHGCSKWLLVFSCWRLFKLWKDQTGWMVDLREDVRWKIQGIDCRYSKALGVTLVL